MFGEQAPRARKRLCRDGTASGGKPHGWRTVGATLRWAAPAARLKLRKSAQSAAGDNAAVVPQNA